MGGRGFVPSAPTVPVPPTACLHWGLWLLWDVPGLMLHPKLHLQHPLNDSLAFFVPATAALLRWGHLASLHPVWPVAGPPLPSPCEEGSTDSLVIPKGSSSWASTNFHHLLMHQQRKAGNTICPREAFQNPEGTRGNFLLHFNILAKSLLSFIHICV